MGFIKKESVEPIPFINLKALTKPDQNKRRNTPHLNSMEYQHLQNGANEP